MSLNALMNVVSDFALPTYEVRESYTGVQKAASSTVCKARITR